MSPVARQCARGTRNESEESGCATETIKSRALGNVSRAGAGFIVSEIVKIRWSSTEPLRRQQTIFSDDFGTIPTRSSKR